MKTLQTIISLCLICLFSATGIIYAEASIQIVSPANGEHFECCQEITIEVDVQTTEGEEIDRVWYYNHDTFGLGSSRNSPWNFPMKYTVTNGCLCVSAVLELKDGTTIVSEAVNFAVGDPPPGECLQNSTFACGISNPWGLYLYAGDGANAHVNVINDERFDSGHCVFLDIENGGQSDYAVHFHQLVPIYLGHVYQISFWAQAPEPKEIRVAVAYIGGYGDSHWATSIQVSELKRYSFTFEANRDTDTDKYVVFGIGGNNIPLYLSDISLVDTTAAAEIGTDVSFKRQNKITEHQLLPAYPNPFNPSTTIEFMLQKSEHANLNIYNMLGQEITTLVSERLNQGRHRYNWNATGLSSGVYFYRLQTDSFVETKKLIYMQ